MNTTSSRTRSSNYNGRGPPSQVQVYAAQAENQQAQQSSDTQDSSTFHSNSYTGEGSTASSYRYDNNNQRNRYFSRDSYFNECHNNDSNNQQDLLPEGTILIKQLNGIQVDLFGVLQTLVP